MIELLDLIGPTKGLPYHLGIIDDDFKSTIINLLSRYIKNPREQKTLLEDILGFGFLFYCERFSFITSLKNQEIKEVEKVINYLVENLKLSEVTFVYSEGITDSVRITPEKIKGGHNLKYFRLNNNLLLIRLERHPNQLDYYETWIFDISRLTLIRLNIYEKFIRKKQKSKRFVGIGVNPYEKREKFLRFLKSRVNAKFSKKVELMISPVDLPLLDTVSEETNLEIKEKTGLDTIDLLKSFYLNLEESANKSGKRSILESRGNFIGVGQLSIITYIDDSGNRISEKLIATPPVVNE